MKLKTKLEQRKERNDFMACKNVCKLCDKLILSQEITFTDGNLVINLPAGNYNNNCKYCIVLVQSIPTDTTIGANVVFTIGTGTVQYPLVSKTCRQITACGVRTRTKYSTCVETTPTGGTFRLLGNPACAPNNNLTAINGDAPAAPATE